MWFLLKVPSEIFNAYSIVNAMLVALVVVVHWPL